MRWRKDEDGKRFLCRWIFEGNDELPKVEDAIQFPTSVEFEIDEESFLLWGMPLWEEGQWFRDEKGQRVWYVTRIPRKLVYPVDEDLAKYWEKAEGREKTMPLCLLVRFYKRNGRPIFYRFVKLEAYSARQFEAQTKEAEQKWMLINDLSTHTILCHWVKGYQSGSSLNLTNTLSAILDELFAKLLSKRPFSSLIPKSAFVCLRAKTPAKFRTMNSPNGSKDARRQRRHGNSLKA
ncbi:MAG: hypothetical protein NZ805_00700 [Armatimonadetes bacterium]|nr:hypothetical protein [Armatimonadota bacterium]